MICDIGAENKYLKNRLVGERETPVFLIIGENRSDPYVIDLDLRDYRYCTFISMLNSYAGFNNKLPGLLDDFDALVQRFIPAGTEERRAIIAEAKQLYEAIDDKKQMSDADYYISVCISDACYLSPVPKYVCVYCRPWGRSWSRGFST